MFAQTAGSELYVLLIEKAMAKLRGSYAGLEGGTPGEAFTALMGSAQLDVWKREEGPAAEDAPT